MPSDAADRLRIVDEDLTSEQQEYLDNFSFRNLLGAVLYLAINTRPDIAYAVGVLAWPDMAITHLCNHAC